MSLKKCVKVGFALKGGNQEELSEYLRKAPATVSKYLNGHIDPPFSVVELICKYFDVNKSEFFKWGE